MRTVFRRFCTLVIALAFASALGSRTAFAAAPAVSLLGKVSGSCTFDKTRTVTFVGGAALPGHLYLSDSPATRVFIADAPLGALRPDLHVEPEDALDDVLGARGGPQGSARRLVTLYIDRTGKLDGLE